MRDETLWCDLCEMAGQGRKKAVARYWDVEDNQWDVCGKCLKPVKEAGLEYERFNVYQEESQDAV